MFDFHFVSFKDFKFQLKFLKLQKFNIAGALEVFPFNFQFPFPFQVVQNA